MERGWCDMATNIIIAGTRTYSDYDKLKQVCSDYVSHLLKDGMSELHEITIVSGMASGADSLGLRFAKQCGINYRIFPADWNTNGKAAGPIRNEEMAKFAVADGAYGILIAFWDGKSRGTGNMIKLAEQYRLKVLIILDE